MSHEFRVQKQNLKLNIILTVVFLISSAVQLNATPFRDNMPCATGNVIHHILANPQTHTLTILVLMHPIRTKKSGLPQTA